MPCLARTPDGYIPTFNIRKGMKLLNRGEWIEAESDSTELPCYLYTFSNSLYTYSKHKDITPSSCNILLPYTSTLKANVGKGFVIQRDIKFPYKALNLETVNMLTALCHQNPTFQNSVYYFKSAKIDFAYDNNEINDIANGIFYHNINAHANASRLIFNYSLNDKAMFFLHLASISATKEEILLQSYYNTMAIAHSFNPTDAVMIRTMKNRLTQHYTDDDVVVSVSDSIFYGLRNQDFDINNFSTI